MYRQVFISYVYDDNVMIRYMYEGVSDRIMISCANTKKSIDLKLIKNVFSSKRLDRVMLFDIVIGLA